MWRTIHRWLGLLIGAQVILWTSTGLIFTLIPVKDELAVTEAKHRPAAMPVRYSDGVDLGKVQAMAGQPIRKIEFTTWKGEEAIRVDLVGGSQPLMIKSDLRSTLPMITAKEAEAAALQELKEPLKVSSVKFIEKKQAGMSRWDYYGDYPVWRVNFSNWKRTRIYVSATTGEVSRRRNVKKTVWDVAYVLHLAAWWQVSMYHNPALMTLAFLAWCLSLTGAWLVYKSFFSRFRRKPESAGE